MKRKKIVAVIAVVLVLVGLAIFGSPALRGSGRGVVEATAEPTLEPTAAPTQEPAPEVTAAPAEPTVEPVEVPTPAPVVEVTAAPTEAPTPEPTKAPEVTAEPTVAPTEAPAATPTVEPMAEPTEEPTPEPTEEPAPEPIEEPTPVPTEEPTPEPTEEPTPEPHVHNYVTKTEEPGCETTGRTYEVCDCGDVRNETVIAALGHDQKRAYYNKATCTHEGYYSLYCARCKTGLGDGTDPVLPHEWDMGTIIHEGSCVEDRLVRYKCWVCEAPKEEYIPQPDAHVWEERTYQDWSEELLTVVTKTVIKCKWCNKVLEE